MQLVACMLMNVESAGGKEFLLAVAIAFAIPWMPLGSAGADVFLTVMVMESVTMQRSMDVLIPQR